VAKVFEVDRELALILSRFEKLGSFHSSIRVPKSSLVSVTVVENPWIGAEKMHGLRAPGTGIPGIVMLGTLRTRSGKEFAAVYGKGSAKVYKFSSGPYRRWIVSDIQK